MKQARARIVALVAALGGVVLFWRRRGRQNTPADASGDDSKTSDGDMVTDTDS